MIKRIAGMCVVLTCSGLLAPVAEAQHREYPGREWHGDIRHFHERDFVRWRGGRWVHGWHGRTFGWWWVVGGAYYAYPAPVYPYPDPYTPPAVVVAPAPPAVIVQAPAPASPAVVIQTPPPAPPVAAAAPPPPAPAAPPVAAAPAGQPGTWYYCDSPQGYYPYVPQCKVQWRAVPASPPPPG